MRHPDEVTAYLRERFNRDYPDWARGGGTWPMRVSLRPPDTSQREADPVACHAWAAAWNTYKGPGRVERAPLRFSTGTHQMPRELILPRPSDVAAASPVTRSQLLTATPAASPCRRTRFKGA